MASPEGTSPGAAAAAQKNVMPVQRLVHFRPPSLSSPAVIKTEEAKGRRKQQRHKLSLVGVSQCGGKGASKGGGGLGAPKRGWGSHPAGTRP